MVRPQQMPTLPARWSARSAIGVVLAVLGVAALLLVTPVQVTADSMRPTMRSGDHVLALRTVFGLGRDPGRGTVVTAHEPRSGQLLVKRVVAVAGDRVGIEDGYLVVNGRRPHEPRVDHDSVDSTYFGPVRVPAGAVFLMGDNRGNSLDSRDFGAVPTKEITGTVLVRLWPPTILR
jgi:signal peptidase I